jgi:2-polyprenyl-3-methyl-5-hydroxy-6-metoxy-1,4-benzoquinol methylase
MQTSTAIQPLIAHGRAARLAGRPAEAVAPLQRAMQLAPENPQVLQEIGLACIGLGDIGNALGALIRALSIDPALTDAARALTFLLEHQQLTDQSAMTTGVVSRLYDRDDINLQLLARSAGNILLRRADMQMALALSRDGTAADLWAAIPGALMAEPLLLKMLVSGYNRDPEIERLLTALRRSFLLTSPALDRPRVDFAAALAQQANNNEFVFFETAEEAEAVDAIGTLDEPRSLLRVAMYRRVDLRPDTEDLLRRDWPPAVASLLDRIIRRPLRERAIARDLPQFTAIRDATSSLVKSHYEESPYPRWFTLTLPDAGIRKAWVEQMLAADGGAEHRLQVLIAGGGTGFQSISTALAYGPEVDVLAIDLSRSSLAYSVCQAEKYGATNLRHMCGDLLEVDQWPGEFDVIESTSVLVRVADPAAGLVGRLRPGGLLFLALHSEEARRDVVAARERIAAAGIADTPTAMRAFRHDLMEGPDLPLKADLLASPGFYTLSTCRDFLFHQAEHRFTLQQVGEMLRANRLALCDWDLPAGVLSRFVGRFGHAADPLNLGQWAAFERENPRTFRGMYRFWCRKL